jgi:hypothetical protein
MLVVLLSGGTGAPTKVGAPVAFGSERAIGAAVAVGTTAGGMLGKVATTGAVVVKVGSMGVEVTDTRLGDAVEMLPTGAEMVGLDGVPGINACGADTGPLPLLPDPPHNGCP